MTPTAIFSHPGLVDIFWREDLKAVHLVWTSEYHPGSGVRDAVGRAIDFVRDNRVENWLVDVSRSHAPLSARDFRWVNGPEFHELIVKSPLRRFVLIPPAPDTGQDTSWVAEWEASTLNKFGDRVAALVCSDLTAIKQFFLAQPTETEA